MRLLRQPSGRVFFREAGRKARAREHKTHHCYVLITTWLSGLDFILSPPATKLDNARHFEERGDPKWQIEKFIVSNLSWILKVTPRREHNAMENFNDINARAPLPVLMEIRFSFRRKAFSRARAMFYHSPNETFINHSRWTLKTASIAEPKSESEGWRLWEGLI